MVTWGSMRLSKGCACLEHGGAEGDFKVLLNVSWQGRSPADNEANAAAEGLLESVEQVLVQQRRRLHPTNQNRSGTRHTTPYFLLCVNHRLLLVHAKWCFLPADILSDGGAIWYPMYPGDHDIIGARQGNQTRAPWLHYQTPVWTHLNACHSPKSRQGPCD